MKNMNDRIFDARLLFITALSDEFIFQAVSGVGYSKERLTSMCETVDKVTALTAIQAKEHADQVFATSEQEKHVAVAAKSYMRIVKLARIAFDDNILAQNELELFTRRKATAGNWFNQADLFYQGLLNQPAYLNTLAGFGLSKADIEKSHQSLKEISTARVIQKQETAQAIMATANRDAELEKMDKLYSVFKKVCRVIFEDDKKSLNQLGL